MSLPFVAPGRLGTPNMTLATDPRALPELLKATKAVQLDGYNHGPYPDLSNLIDAERISRESHEGMTSLYQEMAYDIPSDSTEPEIVQTELLIDGVDGNRIKLHMFRRKDAPSGPLPAIIYIHGGGMTILDTTLPLHIRWCKSLAAQNTVAIAVDFRNAYSPQSHNPFPAGLNDIASAIQYLSLNAPSLHLSTLTLQGESGGSNLALATALKAKRENWSSAISGVFAACPYISNAYHWPSEKKLALFPSLIENEGYFLSSPMMAGMSKYYAPDDGTNPLAWPYYAEVSDLVGLPPHILSMDEVDPLRDEGIAYFRKLVAAGVPATAEINLGIIHGASMIFRKALPEQNEKMIRSIVAFAKSL